MNFIGFVQQEASFNPAFLVTQSGSPVNLDALPLYRVYAGTGLLSGQTGTGQGLETGVVTAASNASPIQITSAAHGLATGQRVTLGGIGGNTAANGAFTITVVDVNNFTLNGSTGNGVYTSGGSWNTTGLYTLSLTAAGASGYQAGQTYSILVQGAISGTPWSDLLTFVVG